MFPTSFFPKNAFAPRFFPRSSSPVVPPVVPVGNHRGGATIYVVQEDRADFLRKRKLKREDEEILLLKP